MSAENGCYSAELCDIIHLRTWEYSEQNAFAEQLLIRVS